MSLLNLLVDLGWTPLINPLVGDAPFESPLAIGYANVLFVMNSQYTQDTQSSGRAGSAHPPSVLGGIGVGDYHATIARIQTYIIGRCIEPKAA